MTLLKGSGDLVCKALIGVLSALSRLSSLLTCLITCLTKSLGPLSGAEVGKLEHYHPQPVEIEHKES